MTPQQIRSLRERLWLSRAAFAKRYGLKAMTIAQWEMGRRKPDSPAVTLLMLIERAPYMIAEILETPLPQIMLRRSGMPENKYAYDMLCEQLAESFLSDYPAATDEDKRELAQAIQTTIEDYLMKFDNLHTRLALNFPKT